MTIQQERTTSGKCASHRLQAQMESRIRELKEDMKHMEEDVAAYEYEIAQEEARRVRNLGPRGTHRVNGDHARHRRERR